LKIISRIFLAVCGATRCSLNYEHSVYTKNELSWESFETAVLIKIAFRAFYCFSQFCRWHTR